MGNQIPNTNEIVSFFHCLQCLDELRVKLLLGEANKVSPRDYIHVEVGFTHIGLQVWCIRHECNIAHFDFEGHRHPANVQKAKP